MEELKERSQGGVARADHLSDAAHNLRDGDLAGGGGATKYITNNIINPVIASRNAVGEKMTVGNGFVDMASIVKEVKASFWNCLTLEK